MKKINKKVLIPVCLVLVVAIVAVVLIIPGIKPVDIKSYSYIADTQKGVGFSGGFSEALEVSGASLFVNETEGVIAFKSSDGKTFFNSASTDAAESLLASVVDLTLRDENGNSYKLNSTDNSVAFGTFEVDLSEKNSVKMLFKFFKDLKNSEKGASLCEIPLELSVENGAFKASVDMSAVVVAEEFFVEKISIMPGLFSKKSPVKNSFYTIPDGSEAQIDLTARSENPLELSLDVYGSDITFSDYSAGANLPCFSFTEGKTAATVIINGGDALSELTVQRFLGSGGNLYNTFTITSCGFINGRFVKGDSYTGVASQLYYITEDSRGDYNTISPVIRNALISMGYLPEKSGGKFTDFPFFITVTGSVNGKKDNIYTTFENASEIVALLKSRGVRSMAMRFSGASAKGLNSSAASVGKLNERLGGKEGFNALCDIASENNSSVWYDSNLSVKGSSSEKGVDVYGDLRSALGLQTNKVSVGSYNSVSRNISSLYKFMNNFENGNVCINDLSFLLYTDIYSGTDRQTALNDLKEKCSALSVNGGLMLSNPAVYLMSHSDAVFTLPQKASCEGINCVKSVPLIQMVLHGSVYYGSEPINLSDNYDDAILRAVEYGACPSFVFTYDGSEKLDYGLYAARTAQYYSQVKRMLPLTDMEITSHKQVVSGVYKIVYDYNKIVYVNYNPSVVEVDGIYVYANDFVII